MPDFEKRIDLLEKRIAELERQLTERHSNESFIDYMYKCMLHYQTLMSKKSPTPAENQSVEA